MSVICRETGVILTAETKPVFVATSPDDKGARIPLSRSAVNRIPMNQRIRDSREFPPKSVVVYRAKVHGKNGKSEIGFNPEKDFLFWLDGKTAKVRLPHTHKALR